jgi:hypothetical protein
MHTRHITIRTSNKNGATLLPNTRTISQEEIATYSNRFFKKYSGVLKQSDIPHRTSRAFDLKAPGIHNLITLADGAIGNPEPAVCFVLRQPSVVVGVMYLKPYQ